MTKSIIITYNETDESLLLALFKKFRIKIETYNQEATTTHTLQQLEASLTPTQRAWWLELKANIKALDRGEDTGGRDAYELLAELQQETVAA